MSMDLKQFDKWARKGVETSANSALKSAVVYTRVSSKEQAEKNLSLDFQMRAIRIFATRNEFTIDSYFGGTFESAKTDGRKEFQRMLEYIAANKGKVSHILVYTLDRFSRTGGAAIKLCDDLRNDYGVSVLAVTQPTDNSNPSGIFQQNIQLLFSEFDNQLRKQRAMAGMKEKFERGIWCIRPPFGYSIIRENGQRRIIINQQGEILRKAFEWKASGVKNQEILEKLQAHGVEMYKQKLSAILSNPFYAGIISTKMLEGKLVEGTHEKLISPELFLKINKPKKVAKSYGVAKVKEFPELPLKVFTRCAECNEPFTGYSVATTNKRFHYYKCRSKGCRCNQTAATLNEQFARFLDSFSIPADHRDALLNILKEKAVVVGVEKEQERKALIRRLATLGQKIASLDEKFHMEAQIDEASYQKLSLKYMTEKNSVETALTEISQFCGGAGIDSITPFITSLASFWQHAPYSVKEKLQALVFPEGVLYHKTGGFTAASVNPFFTQKVAA